MLRSKYARDIVSSEAISSQKGDKHPQFQRAITFLKEVGADVLVTWKPDHISNPVLHLIFQNLLFPLIGSRNEIFLKWYVII